MKFCETEHCTTKAHCKICRDFVRGRKWRESIKNTFEVPDNDTDWECPYGKAWINKPDVLDVTDANSFFQSSYCKSGINCNICRRRENRAWRKGIMRTFPNSMIYVDWECPYGKTWLD